MREAAEAQKQLLDDANKRIRELEELVASQFLLASAPGLTAGLGPVPALTPPPAAAAATAADDDNFIFQDLSTCGGCAGYVLFIQTDRPCSDHTRLPPSLSGLGP